MALDVEDLLVVQGDTLAVAFVDGPPPVTPPPARARIEDDGHVVVQGKKVPVTTEAQLENVLHDESAVPISPTALFEADVHQELGELLPGEVRLRIKAATVRAAEQAYHEASS